MCSGWKLSSGQVGLPIAASGHCCITDRPSNCTANLYKACKTVTHELRLCAGGQINNDDSANDVKVVDLTKVALSRLSLSLPNT